MSRTEPELWSTLEQASGMHHGEAQQALIEDVVQHADAGEFHRLSFFARRQLATAYSVDRQWHKAFPLFARCLSEHDQRPELFGPEEDFALRSWYTNIVQSMAEFPDITLDQIYRALDDVERRFKAGGHNPLDVYDARRWIAQLACDWDEEQRYYQQWMAAGGPNPRSVWDFEVDVERLVRRGDPESIERAMEIAAPALAGELTFTEPPTPIQCLMFLPLARAGRHAEAALAYRRTVRAMSEGVYRYEYGGMQIEFCALTGNEDTGLKRLIGRLHGFPTLNRPNGKMEFAASAAVLLRRLEETGKGDQLVPWGFGEEPTTPVSELREEMTRTALDLAARFDARNGTTAQGDYIRARLALEPITDFLALEPTSRRPLRSTIPRWMSADQILDRAEWHLRAFELECAREHLAAIPETPPPHLAARVTELLAVLNWDADGGAALRWAAEAHKQAGDYRRHLLCRCWLARWLAEHGKRRKAVSEVKAAVQELHNTRDPWGIAWGELRMAQVLVVLRKQGVYSGMQRAAQFAQLSQDPLAVGIIAELESYWREGDKAAPEQVIHLATTAKDALLAAGASVKTVVAFATLKRAHERAGTEAEFVSMVKAQLNDLPQHTSTRVRNHLRYERGLALLQERRYAEAADDLTEAVAEYRSRDQDHAYHWYYLAVAYHSAGRIEDAQQTADVAAAWLYRVREHLDDPTMAERARLILADSYRQLGQDGMALEHFDILAGSARRYGNKSILPLALSAAAELLSEEVKHAQAAARLREASDAYAELGEVLAAAHCLCSEATEHFLADDNEAALATIGLAERAVQAVPAEPARERAVLQGRLDQVTARVLADLGRGPEAVERAARSSTAFRHAGASAEAVETDMFRAWVLVKDDRPDLAEPVLRAAYAEPGPHQPAAARNLEKILRMLGRDAEADGLHAEEADGTRAQ